MKKIKSVSSSDAALVKASSFFDAEWYQARYPDVKMMGVDPVEHFLWVGHRLGRSPSPAFCLPSYRNSHRDIRAAGINPLLHYLRSGIKENRTIYPVREGGSPKSDNRAVGCSIRAITIGTGQPMTQLCRGWDRFPTLMSSTRSRSSCRLTIAGG